MLARTILLELECTLRPGIGGPPRCAAGEPEGTIVRVFPFLGCEAEHIREEVLPAFLQQTVLARHRSLHSVIALDGEVLSPLFPRGQFGLILELESTDNLVAGRLMFEANSQGEIVTIFSGCGLTATEIFDRFPGSDVILSPSEP